MKCTQTKELTEFKITKGVLKSYNGDAEVVVIPESVTEIYDLVFSRSERIKEVYIPSSVTKIGSGAFSSCDLLTDIKVDKNNPFYSDDNGILFNKDKTKIISYPAGREESIYTIPNGVTDVGAYAFCGCNKLTNVIISNEVINIGYGAFRECAALTEMFIPSSVVDIAPWAFFRCYELKKIILSNGVTKIGDAAFGWCIGLTSVSIPNSVTELGFSIFGKCEQLAKVIIPDSVKIIGMDAFSGCGKVTIYCEVSSKPSEWNEHWNLDNRPVVWGAK